MSVWLKDLIVVIIVFIVMGLASLLVLIAYYKNQNWWNKWNKRNTKTNHTHNKLHKGSCGIANGKVIGKVPQNLKEDKGNNSDKNLFPRLEGLYDRKTSNAKTGGKP
jgi:hypothetical protein